jgi:hypothetical protein
MQQKLINYKIEIITIENYKIKIKIKILNNTNVIYFRFL